MRTRQKARTLTTAILTATLATLGVTAVATPAEAAVPAVARTWATLMKESLTVTATGAQLRQTLAAQRATVTTRTAAVTTATAALATARKRVTTATAADKAAKARRTAAQKSLTSWRAAFTTVNKRDKAKLARGRAVVAGAERTLAQRTAQAKTAAKALATAKAAVTTASATLTRATAARTTATAAVTATQRKIAALKTPAELAAKAAALSRDMVTAVRPAFTTADTQVIYGTTVHVKVAYAYQRMVGDANRAGVPMSGGGFRTKQRQIELRKINGCPDIWTAPSSSCRVPTAIPGRSLHEIGLAVDFTSGGKSLTKSSAAFKWLQANAHRYGFKNLPSEPWHWSITGG